MLISLVLIQKPSIHPIPLTLTYLPHIQLPIPMPIVILKIPHIILLPTPQLPKPTLLVISVLPFVLLACPQILEVPLSVS